MSTTGLLNGTGNSIASPARREVEIDKQAVEDLVYAAVARTSGWAIPRLEALASRLAQVIDSQRDEWDRKELPARLRRVLDEWK